jgi:hypothetical protein
LGIFVRVLFRKTRDSGGREVTLLGGFRVAVRANRYELQNIKIKGNFLPSSSFFVKPALLTSSHKLSLVIAPASDKVASFTCAMSQPILRRKLR